MSIEMLHAMNGAACPCGREHRFSARVVTGAGVANQLPEILRELGIARPFLLADRNTWKAAGAQVAEILTAAGIPFSRINLSNDMGSLLMGGL